ncbi:MAG: VTT domain-containing protein [Armatimonadota bacterium]|nr:VTT domain-containing protein [Armatimonadota bacterium]
MAEALLEWIRDHGAIGVFLILAIENVGIPLPTTLAFIVAMDLVRTGRLSFIAAVVICAVAHLTGSILGYALGRAGENAIVARAQRGGGLQRAVAWLHRWYQAHGSVTVFAARVVGQVRPWASIAAGLGEVRAGPFLIWTALGSLLQVAVALKLAEAGWWFWDEFPKWRLALVIGVTVVFWGFLAYVGVRAMLARRRGSGEPEPD